MTYLSNPEHWLFYGFTHSESSKHYHYDPETGLISNSAGRVYTPTIPRGYVQVLIKINGRKKVVYAHRLAWFLYHGSIDPKKHIDHINNLGPKDDNRICNLREVSASRNFRNAKRSSRNSTGEGNISWSETNQRYSVRFGIEGNQYYVNKFFGVNTKRTKEEAFELAIAYRDYSREVLIAADLISPCHGLPLEDA